MESTTSATPTTPSVSVDASSVLERRRRSFVPMSSMEEESLRERLHQAQLRQCSEIVSREQKYSKDAFRRLFQSEVGFSGRCGVKNKGTIEL